jgi:hypothetical protein
MRETNFTDCDRYRARFDGVDGGNDRLGRPVFGVVGDADVWTEARGFTVHIGRPEDVGDGSPEFCAAGGQSQPG